MATSLKAVIRQMLTLDPALGRSEAIASLTTTTAVVTALNSGGSSQRFVNEWLYRQDTATTADRIRRVTSFTPSTGTLTHAGTNYVDTTATGERVEILKHEPYHYSNAVNVTLARLKHNDRTIIPTVQSQDTVWLGGDLNWILQPADILRICWSDNPVLTRNRFFNKYSSYDASGVLAPDFWTAGECTVARSTTQTRRGLPTSLAITTAGSTGAIIQTIGLLENGVSGDGLGTRTVTAALVGWASTVDVLWVAIYDGSTTTISTKHTGNSTWQELTVSAAIPSTATTVQVQVVVDANQTVYASECYALEAASLTDDVRRDNYESGEEEVPRGLYEQGGTLNATLPQRSRRGQWVIWSERSYPQLDATRFAAGTADADEIDAPIVTLATGAIARLYEGLIDPSKPETGAMYGPMAALWNERYDKLGSKHIAPDPGPRPLGALFDRLQPLSAPARRW